MPNFTYKPDPGDPDTVQTHGLTFTAGEWTPIPDDHPAVEKLRANRFFEEQGKATNGNISAADSDQSPPLLPARETATGSTELHNSGNGDMVANGSKVAGIGRESSATNRKSVAVDLSPAQCRAARAGLEWSREQLAKAAKLGERTITDFERGATIMLPPNKTRVQKAFEAAGVTFDRSNGVWLPMPETAAQNTEQAGEGEALAA